MEFPGKFGTEDRTSDAGLVAKAPAKEPVKAILVGSPKAVNRAIHILHSRGIAEICWWSPLVPASNLGHPGDVMSMMHKRIIVE